MSGFPTLGRWSIGVITALALLGCEANPQKRKVDSTVTSVTPASADGDGGDRVGAGTAGEGSATSGDGTSGSDSSGGDNAGGDNAGGVNADGDTTGDSATGGDTTGGDTTGGSATAGNNAGGDTTGGSATAGNNAGGDTTSGSATGGDNAGGDTTGGSTTGNGTATGGGTGSVGSTGPIAGFTPGPSGCTTQQLEANVSVGGFMSDRYGWSDASCLRRTAALVRNDGADPGGSNGGYLRELTLTVNGAPRVARGTGANNWNGWGYVVNHYAGAVDNSKRKTGTFRTVLAGKHHAIHEFVYAQSPGGPATATVRWLFATGRSEPVYAITYDVTAAPELLNADSRAPYGDLAFEGTRGPIGGIGWGDRFRFTTTGNGPVTPATGWDYTQPNTVPYVHMWSANVDAEMGAVGTDRFDRTISGGDYGTGALSACQGKRSANRANGCSAAGQTMPDGWLWPFQLNQYELGATTSSHRMAWGTNYGAIGKTNYTSFGRALSGHPRASYSVLFVVGAHSNEATTAQVTQIERATAAQVTGASWNATWATWDASGNAASLQFDPRGGAITSPVLRLTNFTSARLTEVRVGGVPLTEDQGYFATIDAATQTLWLTLNGTITAPVTIDVR